MLVTQCFFNELWSVSFGFACLCISSARGSEESCCIWQTQEQNEIPYVVAVTDSSVSPAVAVLSPKFPVYITFVGTCFKSFLGKRVEYN